MLLFCLQKRFSDTGAQADNLSKVQGELDELKGIMVKNIGKINFIFVCFLNIRTPATAWGISLPPVNSF